MYCHSLVCSHPSLRPHFTPALILTTTHVQDSLTTTVLMNSPMIVTFLVYGIPCYVSVSLPCHYTACKYERVSVPLSISSSIVSPTSKFEFCQEDDLHRKAQSQLGRHFLLLRLRRHCLSIYHPSLSFSLWPKPKNLKLHLLLGRRALIWMKIYRNAKAFPTVSCYLGMIILFTSQGFS